MIIMVDRPCYSGNDNKKSKNMSYCFLTFSSTTSRAPRNR